MNARDHSAMPAARTASRDELRRRLNSAPAGWVRDALDNPAMGPSELLLLLRNPAAPADVLERIGADRGSTGHHELRRGLTRHAHAPLTLSRNLLPHLYWKDWSDIAADPAANPVVRRQAESLLRGRLGELGVGERVTLARRVTRGLIGTFLGDTEPRVLGALLGNPRLIELDAVRLASAASASADVLQRLAEHPVWGRRREVRLELLRRPELAVQTALRLARQIDRRDLRALVRDARVPLIVRVGIERRLGKNPDERSPQDKPTGAGGWS